MLRHLSDDDGYPGYVRVIAVLLIVALVFGVVVTAGGLLLPVLRWMLPALF